MLKAFAGDLKAVREENNISLRNISQQTRLSLSLLENLENGDFTFQPQAYIRAFLKQYINGLGLDVDETLFEYDLAKSGKYKPKRINANISNENITKKEDPALTKTGKIKPAEELKETKETAKEFSEVTKTEESAENFTQEIKEVKKESPVLNRETTEIRTETRTIPI